MDFIKLLIAISYSFLGYAGFQGLLDEFLDNNLNIKLNEYTKQQVEMDRDAYRAQRTWALELSGLHSENRLENGNTFNFANLVIDEYNLNLSKDLESGTSISFQNELAILDRSLYSPIILGSNPVELTSFTQAVTFEQDLGKNFFGRQFYLGLDALNETLKLAEVTLSQSNQEQLLDFHTRYLDVRLRSTTAKLEKEALVRAQKRYDVTKKRVRDGLNEKADLYQAELGVMRQTETFEQSELEAVEAFNRLGEVLHRNIERKEIEDFPFAKPELTRPITDTLEKNLSLKSIKARVEILKTELENVDRDFLPDVTLAGTYRTNSFNEDGGTALSNGTLGNDSDEVIVSLNVSMPISFQPQKIARAQKNIELISAEIERQALLDQLESLQKTLEKEIQARKSIVLSSSKRLSVAENNLKENNRLYNIGRTDLDGLIRAEEDLITTQRSYVNNWYRYENAIARKASLYNKLLPTLRGSSL